MPAESKPNMTFPGADGTDLGGFLVEKQGSTVGLVCLQEWWGLNDQLKRLATTASESMGVTALVPDLYKGTVALEVKEAEHNMNGLDWGGAVANIGAAVAHLKKMGCKDVFVAGFCMGGALSILSAVNIPGLAGAVVFYGMPPKDAADLSKVGCPLQLHYGEKDTMAGFSDPAAAADLKERLTAAGAKFDMFNYPTVGHAFLNSDEDEWFREIAKQMNFEPVDRDAQGTAWARFADFVKANSSA